MKLYTEEQVNEIIDIAEFNKHLTNDDILKEFTSIELPSDEEIQEYIRSIYSFGLSQLAFEQGAKWVIEQIKQQENGK